MRKKIRRTWNKGRNPSMKKIPEVMMPAISLWYICTIYTLFNAHHLLIVFNRLGIFARSTFRGWRGIGS